MKFKAALIVVFNHQYINNLEKLDYIYRNRFSDIFYLMPFYKGDRPDVIPVYGNSHFFQGYMAQAFNSFYHSKYTHYIFIADDLLLNPEINEYSYSEHFKLEISSSFIPEIHQLHHLKNNKTLEFIPVKGNPRKWFWWRVNQALAYSIEQPGINIQSELPSYDEAVASFLKNNYKIKPLKIDDVQGRVPDISQKDTRFCLKYPLVAAYSDIVIVSQQVIRNFCHYCGVFAATNLFVELAIPTALALSTNKIITENQINRRGKIFWIRPHNFERYQKFMESCNGSIQCLQEQYPADLLYIHPIKLSQWTI